jgi:peptidoglycan/xylan/chitin deacetylase (PgdA/CDA1 family)
VKYDVPEKIARANHRPHQRATLSILIYHRVRAVPDPLFPNAMHAGRFDAHVRLLRRFFSLLPLDEAIERLMTATLPARAVTITFDDGYADNHDVALPILLRHRATATFFISTGFLDGGLMWNDVILEGTRRFPGNQIDLESLGIGAYPLRHNAERRAAMLEIIDRLKYMPHATRTALAREIAGRSEASLPDNLMMRAEQVAALSKAGMGIGAHTVTHPILAHVDDATARKEIAQGRSELQSITGTAVDYFAYPNGRPGRDYAPVHVAMVREAGFRAALSTAQHCATPADNRFELPRFTPWARGGLGFTVQLFRSRSVS